MKRCTKRHYIVLSVLIMLLIGLYIKQSTDQKPDDRKIVVVNTGKRVGSTILYNTIAKICEVAGKTDCYASCIGKDTNYDPENPAKFHVIKTHAFRLEESHKRLFKNAIFITAIRDPRDVLASRIALGSNPVSNHPPLEGYDMMEAFLNENRKLYNMYKAISAYEVRYEEAIQNPEKMVAELAEVVGLPLTSEQIEEVIAYRNKLGDKDYLSTLTPEEVKVVRLTPARITGNKGVYEYKHRLTREQICFVEEKFRDWMLEMGYELECTSK